MVMELPLLESPMSFLELEDGASVTYHVSDWQLGRSQVSRPWMPPGDLTWVTVLRLHVLQEEKPMFPHYVDVGQKTLIPQLAPILPRARAEGASVRIEAVGIGPKKRFSVSLV